MKTSAPILVILSLLCLSSHADEGAVYTSASVKPGAHNPILAINASTRTIRMSSDISNLIFESCHQYQSFLPIPEVLVQPGEVKILDGLIQQYIFANHYHANLGSWTYTTGSGAGNHHDLIRIGLLLNQRGELAQVQGEYGHGPALLQPPLPTLPDNQYSYWYWAVGSPIYQNSSMTFVFTNGPSPNRIDVKVVSLEFPPPNTGNESADVAYRDLGELQPGQTVVVDIPNPFVYSAHHAGPTITMEIQDGASWYMFYRSSGDGSIYNIMNKDAFSSMFDPRWDSYAQILSSVTLLSPANNSAVGSLTPTLQWRVPNIQFPGVNVIESPPGCTQYHVLIATTANIFLNTRYNYVFNQVVCASCDPLTDPPTCGFTVPATDVYGNPILEANRNYWWWIRYFGTLPGIPSTHYASPPGDPPWIELGWCADPYDTFPGYAFRFTTPP